MRRYKPRRAHCPECGQLAHRGWRSNGEAVYWGDDTVEDFNAKFKELAYGGHLTTYCHTCQQKREKAQEAA